MSKLTLALALAGISATASALTLEEGPQLPSGGVTIGSWDSYAGAYATAEVQMDEVVVTGKKTTLPPGSIVSVTNIALVPHGDSAGNTPTPEEQQRIKDQCIKDCGTNNAVELHNCDQSNTLLRSQLAEGPYAAGMLVGGITAVFFIRKPRVANPKLSRDIDWEPLAVGLATYALADKEVEKFLLNDLANCRYQASVNYTSCLRSRCRAWFMPLALLPFRRRREEDDEERLALA
jgi:hypothetical protein